MAKTKFGAMRRSWFMGAAALAVTLAFSARSDRAKYPSQDIHIIWRRPAGSGADVIVRFFAERLRAKSGVSVVVENKVGAGGNIAAEYTARAKPDGNTMHVHAGSTVAANYWLFKKPPIDPDQRLAGCGATAQPAAFHDRRRHSESA